ncbi:plasmid stabilization protein [Comamonas sp. B-9]|uniref:plasmid stabilization protein n=1 Tax=Comamonas sp. B-9 TaxID=1055192 RepID=UPI001EF9D462|nr:plasmid stabilization protein [Comamonas sp. B-9]
MPQGDKSAYTDKQKRMARHIEKSYEQKGVSEDEAAARAWATVNKETGGGKLSGSGRQGDRAGVAAGGRALGSGQKSRRQPQPRGALRIGQKGGGHPQAQRRCQEKLSMKNRPATGGCAGLLRCRFKPVPDP